jgi:HEPN domain-containing protein
MLSSEILTQINREFELAEQARLQNNEGMTRVCARRAAGFAAQACLARLGIDIRHINGLDALFIVSQKADFPDSIRRYAETLTMRVNPHHQLPVSVDLLHTARQFIQELNQWMEDRID